MGLQSFHEPSRSPVHFLTFQASGLQFIVIKKSHYVSGLKEILKGYLSLERTHEEVLNCNFLVEVVSLPNSHRYNLGGIFCLHSQEHCVQHETQIGGMQSAELGEGVWERKLPQEEERWGEVQGQAIKKRALVTHRGEDTGLDGTSESHSQEG